MEHRGQTYYPGQLIKTVPWELAKIAEDCGLITIPANSIVLNLRLYDLTWAGTRAHIVLFDGRLVNMDVGYLREVVSDGNYSRF